MGFGSVNYVTTAPETISGPVPFPANITAGVMPVKNGTAPTKCARAPGYARIAGIRTPLMKFARGAKNGIAINVIPPTGPALAMLIIIGVAGEMPDAFPCFNHVRIAIAGSARYATERFGTMRTTTVTDVRMRSIKA